MQISHTYNNRLHETKQRLLLVFMLVVVNMFGLTASTIRQPLKVDFKTTNNNTKLTSDAGAGEITLTSDSETTTQIRTVGDAIDDITYVIGGAATIATVQWWGTTDVNTPPEGISVYIDGINVSILGTPSVVGSYEYTITTDGDPVAEEGGSIAVRLVTPTLLVATNITNEGFTAQWNDIDGESSYTVNFYESGNLVISLDGIPANETSIEITGLNAYTTYFYTVTAIGDGNSIPDSEQSSESEEVTTLNSEATIYSFTIEGQVSSTIDDTNISIVIPATVMRYGLAPTSIELSDYAEITPSQNVAQDFRTPVVYTVTAQDGTIKLYTVTISNQLVASRLDNAIGYSTSDAMPAPGESKTISSGSNEFKYTASTDVTTQSDYTILSGVTYNCLKIGNSSNADLNVYYIEGALTSKSSTASILALQIGTTSGASTANYAIVYSNEYPFNSLSVIRGQALTSTSNTLSSMSLGTGTVPANAKSFRIYRRVTTPATYGVGTSQYVFYIKTTITSEGKLPSTPLPPPLLLSVSNPTNEGFTANWTDGSNEIGYVVKVYDEENALVTSIEGIATNTTSVNVTGLNANEYYTYSVTAVGEGEIYTNSDESSPSESVRTLSKACGMNEFSISGQISSSIEGTDISVVMPYGVAVNGLTPNVTVSTGAYYSPTGAQDFSSAVEYTVTAEDGITEQHYTITVSNLPPSTACDLFEFSIDGQVSAMIEGTVISVVMPYGVALNGLTPNLTVSTGAYYSPTGAQDFSSAVEYTVTAEDGITKQQYTVTVSNIDPTIVCDITSLSIAGQIGTTSINGTNISVIMPFGADLTSLTPSITLSTYATVDPLSDVSQDFSSPIVYTVTAQDGITKQQYTVTVSIGLPRILVCSSESDFAVLGYAVSSVQQYTITGSNLLTNISVSVDDPFQVSADNQNWGTTATVAKSDYSISAPLYVRYNPYSGSYHNAIVSLKSLKAENNTIATEGEVLKLTNTTDYFRSKRSGEWTTAGNWECSSDNATWHTAILSPTAAATKITVRNGHTMTVGANTSVDDMTIEAGAQVTISSGYILTVANGAAAYDLIVNGILKNSGTLTPIGTIVIANGAIYEHNIANLTIPTITWNTNSTLKISGTWTNMANNTSLASLSGSTFRNLTIACDIQGSSNYINLSGITIGGKLKVISTGNGKVLVTNSTSVFTCASFEQIGGTVIINRQSTTDNRSMKVNGDATISSGTLYLKYNAINSTLTSLGILSIGGNLMLSGGVITNDAATGQTISTVNPQIVFNGTAAQTFTVGEGAAFGGSGNKVDVVVNNSKGLLLGSDVTIYGNLTLQAGNLTLVGYDLTVWNPIAGTPTASNHIVTNDVGKLISSISSGSYVFPIGADDTHYNAVTLTNNTGGMMQTYSVNVTTLEASSLLIAYQWNIAGITSGNGKGTAVSLQWGASDASGVLSTTPTKGILYKNDGEGWSAQGGSTSDAYVTNLTGVTNSNASLWTVGCGELYKSISAGNWDGDATWEVSVDGGATYVPTSLEPGISTAQIEINNTVSVPSEKTVYVSNIQINPTGKLLIDGNITVDNTITFIVNDSQTSQLLINNGEITTNGNVRVRKTFTSLNGRYFVSFPFDVPAANIKIAGSATNATWGDITDNGKDFYVAEYDGHSQDMLSNATPNYNTPGTYWQNVSPKSLKANKGYKILVDRDITLDFISVANETGLFASSANVLLGSYSTNANPEHHSWNLVGIPFTASFDMDYASQDQVPFYYFNGTQYITVMAGDGYEVYPFTSFFLQRNSGASIPSMLTFSSAGRMLKASSDVIFSEINLVIKNTTYSDKVRIRLQNEATQAYELGKDAVKFFTPKVDVPQIYSKQNGYNLSVNSLPLSTTQVDVDVKIGQAGFYSISLEDVAKATGCSQIVLLDNTIGTETDLLLTPQGYEFEGTAGMSKSLTLFFVAEGTEVPNAIGGGSTIHIKTIGNKLYVTGLEGMATVNVYDVSGKLVQTFSNVNNNEELLLTTNGIYILDVKTATQIGKAKVSVKK